MDDIYEESLTLIEAKAILRESFNNNKSMKCPCCKQTVKKYPRSINSAMVYALIEFYHAVKATPDKYIHISKFFQKYNIAHLNTALCKFQYWHLIEKQPGKRDDGNPSKGFWKITQKGIDTIVNNLPLEVEVIVYNEKVLSRSKETCLLSERLNKKFNYDELMAER